MWLVAFLLDVQKVDRMESKVYEVPKSIKFSAIPNIFLI